MQARRHEAEAEANAAWKERQARRGGHGEQEGVRAPGGLQPGALYPGEPYPGEAADADSVADGSGNDTGQGSGAKYNLANRNQSGQRAGATG